MHFAPFIAATTESAAHSHSILDALPHIAGMAMVMVALAFLWGVCAFTARLTGILQPSVKPAAAPATQAPAPAAAPPPAAPHAGVAPELVAVIAAAVATATGQACRIISIKPMSTSWERAGRQSVLTSHRIR